VVNLVVDLVDHLMETPLLEELDLVVGRALDVGEDEGVEVHGLSVSVERHEVAVLALVNCGIILLLFYRSRSPVLKHLEVQK